MGWIHGYHNVFFEVRRILMPNGIFASFKGRFITSLS